jgi:hypothetical protein
MRKSIAATFLIALATVSVAAIEGVSTGVSAAARSSGHGGGHSGSGNSGDRNSGQGNSGQGHSGQGDSGRGNGGGPGASGHSNQGDGSRAGSSGGGGDNSGQGNGAGAGSSNGNTSAPGNSAGGVAAGSNSTSAAGGSPAQSGVSATQRDPTTGSITATGSAIAQARGGRSDIELPQSLLPGPSNYSFPLQSLSSIPGTPDAVVRACVQAIATAAKPYGVIRIDAASSGPLRARRRGAVAPLEVRIQYARRGGVEVRQSQVDCRLNAAGAVVALR